MLVDNVYLEEILTHWGRDEMNNISQTTFSNVFSSMKMFQFRLKFHWRLFPRVQLTIALVQIMAWRRSGDKPLSEPMIVRLPTHICTTRPQWVTTLTSGFVAIIPDVYFSNSLYRLILNRMVAWALAVKLLSDECHRTPSMTNQHWFR